jgi:hypothetical protein
VIASGTTALLAAVLLPALGGKVLTTIPVTHKGSQPSCSHRGCGPSKLLSLLLLVALIAALAVSRMPATPDEPAPATSDEPALATSDAGTSA